MMMRCASLGFYVSFSLLSFCLGRVKLYRVPWMSLREVVSKQLLRQAVLQPRLKLPAGRIISVEEGWRLARLVHEEEERTAAAASGAAADGVVEPSAVVLEDAVAKRILLLRQRGKTERNVRATVGHAQDRRAPPAARDAVFDVHNNIAQKLLRKGSGGFSVSERRHMRKGSGKKPKRA
ncbi:unnamed protein product [Trypanosoma congolense IL3000]|uniref:WGS project CAEQ00000000 data, annotated contig 2387 n=1 Tax=Trypanosoma congolense (strain IL3000) TaxID=1068625 RepID=F9WDQ0_TRYCI|nr:unnamed protein product [Trypanosoma congolense IL3000]